jgi:Flp pilus assembly protein TadG
VRTRPENPARVRSCGDTTALEEHRVRRSFRSATRATEYAIGDTEGSRERGAIIILVALTLTILVGLIGLGMDAGQMFVAKQQLQSAADAAAMAGVMDMYNGTNSSGGSSYGTHHVCSSSDTWTPCKYALLNLTGRSSTVTIDFPSAAPAFGSSCTTGSSTSNICVTATTTVNTTLLRALPGLSTSATVSATAAASILLGPASVPIVVTHPHLKDALSTSGNSTIKITGGPQRTIQVNSDGTSASGTAEAFTVGGSSYIDISRAGPSGTGGDFRSWGPGDPAVSEVSTSTCSGKEICLGSTGSYAQPASIINDPFASLTQPSKPGTAGSFTNITAGNSKSVTCSGKTVTFTCPSGAISGSCRVYTPGYYDGGIQVKNNAGYFCPGLYYITSNDTSTGFVGDSNSDLKMVSSLYPSVVDSNADFSNGGMVVFNAGGGVFSVGSNGNADLTGANLSSSNYEGILFWEDRTRNPGKIVTHGFGGNGSMILTGSIYVNMQNTSVTNTNYQAINLQGKSGNTTKVIGEIVTNVLSLGGTGDINMVLNSTLVKDVKQVALVQ